MRYGWILALVAPLVWLRHQPVRVSALRPAAWAQGIAFALLVLAALAVWPARWLGEANPEWRFPVWTQGLAAGVITLAAHYLAGGFTMLRVAILPVAILLASLPWPAGFENLIREDGAEWVCAVAAELLSSLGVPAIARANVLEMARGPVGVDEACSGLHGTQNAALAAVALCALFALRGRRLLAVFGLAALLALVSNLTRVVVLAAIHNGSGAAGFHAWHDQVGLLASAVPLALLLWYASSAAQVRATLRTPAAAAPAARRILAWATTVVLAGVLFSEGFVALWYRAPVVADTRPAPEFAFPRTATGFAPLTLGDDIISQLRCQRSSAAGWVGDDGTRWTAYSLHWEAGRAAMQVARAHNPQNCFLMGGATQLEHAEPLDLRLPDGRALRFERFAFAPRQLPGQNPGVTYVFFARRSAGQDDLGTSADPWSRGERLRLAREGRRPSEQQVYEVTLRGPADLASATEVFKREVGGMLR